MAGTSSFLVETLRRREVFIQRSADDACIRRIERAVTAAEWVSISQKGVRLVHDDDVLVSSAPDEPRSTRHAKCPTEKAGTQPGPGCTARVCPRKFRCRAAPV